MVIAAVAAVVLNADVPACCVRSQTLKGVPAVSSQPRYVSVAEPLVLNGRLFEGTKRSCMFATARLGNKKAELLGTLGSATQVDFTIVGTIAPGGPPRSDARFLRSEMVITPDAV